MSDLDAILDSTSSLHLPTHSTTSSTYPPHTPHTPHTPTHTHIHPHPPTHTHGHHTDRRADAFDELEMFDDDEQATQPTASTPSTASTASTPSTASTSTTTEETASPDAILESVLDAMASAMAGSGEDVAANLPPAGEGGESMGEFLEALPQLEAMVKEMEGILPALNGMMEGDDEEARQAFEAMAGDEGMAKMMDALLAPLIHKDLLQEPIRAIADMFTPLLAGDNLDQAERERFTAQHNIFLQIDQAFENDPQPAARVLELLTQMQDSYGSLPPSIQQAIDGGGDDGEGGDDNLASLMSLFGSS